jgi:hypothetical protein
VAGSDAGDAVALGLAHYATLLAGAFGRNLTTLKLRRGTRSRVCAASACPDIAVRIEAVPRKGGRQLRRDIPPRADPKMLNRLGVV